MDNETGQDIAEYAVMLAVILVIVVGTIRLVGTNANNVFSSVASSVSVGIRGHEFCGLRCRIFQEGWVTDFACALCKKPDGFGLFGSGAGGTSLFY